MTAPLMTLSFAVFTGLWLMYLQYRIIQIRRTERIAYDHGENKELRGWIRAHANAIENMLPFGLLSLCYELAFGGGLILGALLVVMTLGRIIHPQGLVAANKLALRTNGMMLTLIAQGLLLIWAALRVIGEVFMI